MLPFLSSAAQSGPEHGCDGEPGICIVDACSHAASPVSSRSVSLASSTARGASFVAWVAFLALFAARASGSAAVAGAAAAGATGMLPPSVARQNNTSTSGHVFAAGPVSRRGVLRSRARDIDVAAPLPGRASSAAAVIQAVAAGGGIGRPPGITSGPRRRLLSAAAASTPPPSASTAANSTTTPAPPVAAGPDAWAKGPRVGGRGCDASLAESPVYSPDSVPPCHEWLDEKDSSLHRAHVTWTKFIPSGEVAGAFGGGRDGRVQDAACGGACCGLPTEY